MTTKDGSLITDADGKPVPGKIFGSPALAHYTRLLEVLGISLPELLATPQARSRAKVQEDTGDAVQSLLGGIFQRTRKPTGAAALPEATDADE
jgi:hypothetical protein